MNKWLSLVAPAGLVLGLFSAAQAAGGNVETGKSKAELCIACHGVNGNSELAINPKLAGQVPGYIASQLAAFNKGKRNNPIMVGIAQGLSDEDMQDLDAYYSGQTIAPGAVTEEQAAVALAAETIYRGGVRELQVPACMSCHGPSGAGIPVQFPRVAGQHSEYLESQLLAFKTGAREHEIMSPIAFRLSEQQIKQLALYMQALH
ncbi:MAG: cytochrome c4 [Gammaproteobacteria bacterium]|nr:cytochrome c4 [Gammaproteobacteria bacterium]MDH3466737.1 cytochrome c4 [Gammaproteobacteria bacterium]